jgi:hypothetical protein
MQATRSCVSFEYATDPACEGEQLICDQFLPSQVQRPTGDVTKATSPVVPLSHVGRLAGVGTVSAIV